jgi:Nucleotidyl transferase
MLLPVILSGGAGTRLWPYQGSCIKQLLALAAEQTMLQETAMRLAGLNAAAPLLICNEAHRFLMAEQSRQLGIKPAAILLEPVGYRIWTKSKEARIKQSCALARRRTAKWPKASTCRSKPDPLIPNDLQQCFSFAL